MAKKRIHQIAKELDIASADVLFHAKELGFEVKTASSGLTEEEEELLKLALLPEDEPESESEVVQEQEETIQDAPKTEVEEVPEDDVQIIEISRNSSPEKISSLIDVDATQIVGDLMGLGIMKAIDTPLEDSDIEKLFEKYNLIPDLIDEITISREDIIEFQEFEDDPDKLNLRAPIITVMGHVDHGKTSLLDYIRNEKVADGEAGGITQHVGAYKVDVGESGITFIDTPGHEAFTQMRARGANVTDIVVLVVAADDGVMPQTIEAINHAKEAKVPMIVAINKIDKQGSDPNKVRTELLQHGIIVESMSGDVLEAEISATNGTGLEKLLENITLQAELLELKTNEKRPAEGTVVEAKLDMGRGPVATVLVQKGTLKKGDIFVVGQQWGKVRALFNDKKEKIDLALPSTPVEVLGLNGTPEAGDILNVLPSEAKAREISVYREQNIKNKKNTVGMGSSLDQLLAKAKEDEKLSFLPIIVKSDVRGSGEAIVQAMEKIKSEEVEVRVVHSGVGAITESDITLALSSNSIIIGFNVRANTAARESASQKKIDIRYYSIIYDLVDDITKAAEGLLSPEIKETFIGYAKIQEVFKITGVGKIAGCLVTEGHAKRDVGVRLLREDVVIHTGKLKTLKRFKDEVKEVQSGQECGMAFEAYEDIRKDDVIEIFTTQEVARTLN